MAVVVEYGSCLGMIEIKYCVDYRFVISAVEVLEQNIGVEGLFRKSGAVNRLKELRVCSITFLCD